MGRSNVGDGFVMPYFAAYETGFVPFGQPLVLPCVVIVPLLINVVNALACDIKLILNSYSYSSKLFRIDEINCKKRINSDQFSGSFMVHFLYIYINTITLLEQND